MEKPSDLGIAIEELEGAVTALDVEEGFCWDHGYYLGPRCLRCGPQNGEPRISRVRRPPATLAARSARKETHNG